MLCKKKNCETTKLFLVLPGTKREHAALNRPFFMDNSVRIPVQFLYTSGHIVQIEGDKRVAQDFLIAHCLLTFPLTLLTSLGSKACHGLVL